MISNVKGKTEIPLLLTVFVSPGGYLNLHLSHSIFLITIWPTLKKWPDIHLLSKGFMKIPIFTTLFAPFTED